ncbi:MAG: HAD family phosphatase, partial [Bdellovibrionales bacterium]|nr:HAD family phosphatase [Bdellovibrionales bacterium]
MIIFDLDGTLINSELFLKEIETELKCELGFEISLKEQIDNFGGIGPHQQLEMDKRLPAEFATVAESRFRERAKDHLKANPGVIEFLENYDGKKVIASNGPLEWIQRAIEVTGLSKFFKADDLFHVGLVENKKPAPDLFLLAGQRANSDEEIFVVEDSLTGVKAGVAASYKTLGYLGTSSVPTH